jgi:hypothetical protein
MDGENPTGYQTLPVVADFFSFKSTFPLATATPKEFPPTQIYMK